MIRRPTVIKSLAWLLIASLSAAHLAWAQADAGKLPARRDAIDKHLDDAIAFLRAQQDERDGWISDGRANRVAMTALSIMAMAAVGNQPSDRTPTGVAMRRALAFVLRPENQDRSGYFGGLDGSRMYGHGIITLMLGEMVGMGADKEQDKLILERLENGIDLILKAQNIPKRGLSDGGWRYLPQSRDADLSISVWQVMALRSAKNAGLEVPPDAIRRAVEYLQGSYQSRRDRKGRPIDRRSGFSYTPGGRVGFSTTAAGLLALQVCGRYDSDEVNGAADWLRDYRVRWGDQWFYYGTYYYAQGMYQRGGDYAQHARRVVESILPPQQRKDGSWPPAHGGTVYATCMAVLSLSVKYHYLPIYQR